MEELSDCAISEELHQRSHEYGGLDQISRGLEHANPRVHVETCGEGEVSPRVQQQSHPNDEGVQVQN